MDNSSQKIGLILIGNELLNGSRQDKHMSKVIELLHERGLGLSWVRILGDTKDQLISTFTQTLALDDVVFSFGGIGATPDDITRLCAAEASSKKLVRHPQAQALIEEKFKDEAYPNRILMSDLPEGADLIPNSINKIPGFKLNHHHFVPGFPNMAWPMIEWVLDTHYSHLFNQHPDSEMRWDILGVPESTLLDSMNELVEQFPSVDLSSLPSTERRGELIDFGLKGQPEELQIASKWLENRLNEMNIPYKVTKQLQ